jgi:glyoxylase-like metal-dependent hydrolase (beta-lactamase superfamily II)
MPLVGPSRVILDRLVLTSAESNCFIVGSERGREAIVIDPGAEAERISRRLAEVDLRPTMVIITHAHWDHVNAAGALSEQYSAPVAMHPADRDLLTLVPEVTRQRTGTRGPEPPCIGRALADGDELSIGDLSLRVMHTPGHTPGSVCLLGEGILFSGDTLMAGWVGRTDRPGGDQQAIRTSLWDRLLRLPDETMVYAGHLETTSIGAERRDNPYLNGRLPLR